MKKFDLLYYIGVFLAIVISLCDISRIINIDGVFRTVVYFCSMLFITIKIIKTKYTKNELSILLILGILCLYASTVLSDYTFLMNILIIIGLININIKKIIKIDLAVKLFFLILHTIIYFYDMLYNYWKIIPYFVLTKKYGARHSLYFSHPNSANGVVIWLVIDWIIISKNKKLSVLLGSALVIYYSIFTVSRTSIIIYILFLLIVFFSKNNIIKKISIFLQKYLFIILTVLNAIIISLTQFYSSELIQQIDILFSKRLTYSKIATDTLGIHFFPNNISDALHNNLLIIDNFYIKSFVCYGFVFLLILCVIYIFIGKHRNVNQFELAVLIIFPIYLVNELFVFNICRAIPLLVIGNIILNKKKEKGEKYEV